MLRRGPGLLPSSPLLLLLLPSNAPGSGHYYNKGGKPGLHEHDWKTVHDPPVLVTAGSIVPVILRWTGTTDQSNRLML